MGVAGQGVDLADGGQAAGDSGHRGGFPVVVGEGQLAHVPGHRARRGREGVESGDVAPGGEVGPVRRVGP